MVNYSEPKTFVIISPSCSFPPSDGGSEVVADLARRISKDALTHFLVRGESHVTTDEQIRVVNFFRLGKSPYFDIFLYLKLFKYLKLHKPDCCILVQPFFFLPVAICNTFLRFRFVTYTLNIETQRFFSMRKWWSILLFPFEFVAYRASRKVLFISRADQQYAKKYFLLKAESSAYLPHGLRFQYRAEILPCRTKSSGPQIIFFGNFFYLPNRLAAVDLIEQICPELKKICSFKYEVIIAGHGLDLKNYSEDYMRANNLRYLGHVKDLELEIKKSNVMVSPVRTGGGIQTKIIDAVSCGVPVVASVSGCTGLDVGAFGSKLVVQQDCHWGCFAESIKYFLDYPDWSPPPTTFLDHYAIDRTIKKLVDETL